MIQNAAAYGNYERPIPLPLLTKFRRTQSVRRPGKSTSGVYPDSRLPHPTVARTSTPSESRPPKTRKPKPSTRSVFVGQRSAPPKNPVTKLGSTFTRFELPTHGGKKGKVPDVIGYVFGGRIGEHIIDYPRHRPFRDDSQPPLPNHLYAAMTENARYGPGEPSNNWTFSWPLKERPDSTYSQASNPARLPPKVRRNIFGKLLSIGPLFERFDSWRDALRDRVVRERESLLDTIFNPGPTNWRRVGSLCIPTPPVPYENLVESSRLSRIATEPLSTPWLRRNDRRPRVSIAPNHGTTSFLWLPV